MPKKLETTFEKSGNNVATNQSTPTIGLLSSDGMSAAASGDGAALPGHPALKRLDDTKPAQTNKNSDDTLASDELENAKMVFVEQARWARSQCPDLHARSPPC